ncbi:MAG: hypothetical protein FWC54_02730 [Actinomycetia bacterium]|nr:hypothetical protein [Actinomycetes bacterium]
MKKAGRIVLLVISLLNGIAGLVCGILMIVKPDGSLMAMQSVIPVLRQTPVLGALFFRDLLWVGIVMLLALGIPSSLASVLTIRKHRCRYRSQLFAGICLLLWCITELFIIPNPVVVGYLVVGIVQVVLAISLRAPADRDRSLVKKTAAPGRK